MGTRSAYVQICTARTKGRVPVYSLAPPVQSRGSLAWLSLSLARCDFVQAPPVRSRIRAEFADRLYVQISTARVMVCLRAEEHRPYTVCLRADLHRPYEGTRFCVQLGTARAESRQLGVAFL